jgi:hypothetical protein
MPYEKFNYTQCLECVYRYVGETKHALIDACKLSLREIPNIDTNGCKGFLDRRLK